MPVFFKTEGDEKGAIFAATDSYRLSECRLTLGGDAQGETISIVPSRSMQEISRIISGYKDDIQGSLEVSLSFTDNQLVMSYGSVELVTRLLEEISSISGHHPKDIQHTSGVAAR